MCRPHNAEKNPVSSTESAYVAGFQGIVKHSSIYTHVCVQLILKIIAIYFL